MLTQLPLSNLGYPGYSSLHLGHDYKAIEMLLALHSPVPNPYILDCTFGRGIMWENCVYQPDFRTDILPEGVNAGADFRTLPFKEKSFDVIIFDPPHITNYQGPKSSRFYADRYGIDRVQTSGPSIAISFIPFLLEAKRLLRKDGIVLAKLIDHVEGSIYYWEQVAFVNMAQEVGLRPCDMLIKKSPAGQLISSKWKNQMHTRRGHCYWIVVRKGGCERPC